MSFSDALLEAGPTALFIMVPTVVIIYLVGIFLNNHPNNETYGKTKFRLLLWWGLLKAKIRKDRTIFVALINNPYIAPTQLRLIYRSRILGPNSYYLIAKQTTTPYDVLEDLAKKTVSTPTKEALLANVSIPEEVRAQWAFQWELV